MSLRLAAGSLLASSLLASSLLASSLLASSLLASSLLASLGLFTTESKASTTSQPDPVELQGIAAFHRPFMTYHLLHGNWQMDESHNGKVRRYRPTGNEEHCLEMAWSVAHSSTPLFVLVPAGGEVYELNGVIVLDSEGRDNIEFRSISAEELIGCDSDKSLVISNVMTGTCWEKPFAVDPENGRYTRKCNKSPGTNCVATVTQNTNPPTVSTTTWQCGADDRTVFFNPSSGAWSARNAMNCGSLNPDLTLR